MIINNLSKIFLIFFPLFLSDRRIKNILSSLLLYRAICPQPPQAPPTLCYPALLHAHPGLPIYSFTAPKYRLPKGQFSVAKRFWLPFQNFAYFCARNFTFNPEGVYQCPASRFRRLVWKVANTVLCPQPGRYPGCWSLSWCGLLRHRTGRFFCVRN